ncbi:MAG: methyltransferase [Bilophila sp.]
MNVASDAAVNRARFPRGLEQPEGSFRFSMDALLLAAFAAEEQEEQGAFATQEKEDARPQTTFADLGTGCGVVGLALLLRQKGHGIGLDLDADLVLAAQRNAAHLGFSDCFTALLVDLADEAHLCAVRQQYGAMDLVLANPPWRLEGTGRVPVSPARRKALFGDSDSLRRFVHAATVLSAQKSRFVCILGANRLPDMLQALHETPFRPARLRFVHKKSTSPAMLCLLETRRTAATLVVEPPLFLYEADHSPTQAALTFCPSVARKDVL